MSILSVFDVIEVIWTPQNAYLPHQIIKWYRIRGLLVLVWLVVQCDFFYKSTVDKLMSTLASAY